MNQYPSIQDAAGTATGAIFFIGFSLAGLAAYFFPTIVAMIRKKTNTGAIFLLNLLLGWSVIGWIVALVWAVSTQMVDQTGEDARCIDCNHIAPWRLGRCPKCGHVYGTPPASPRPPVAT